MNACARGGAGFATYFRLPIVLPWAQRRAERRLTTVVETARIVRNETQAFVASTVGAIGRIGVLFSGLVLILGTLWWSGSVSNSVVYWFESILGVSLVALTFLRSKAGLHGPSGKFVLAVYLVTLGNAAWSLVRVWEASGDTSELLLSLSAAVFATCTVVGRLLAKSVAT